MSLKSAKEYIKENATIDYPEVDKEIAIINTSALNNALYKASLPEWNEPPIYPEVGSLVVAIVEWFKSKKRVPVVLKFVKEDDCNWRTADDNSELDYSLSVVKWYLMPPF